MLGAIAGDIIGSYFEHFSCKTDQPSDIGLFVDGSRATDDTVLTVAVAEWILQGGPLYQYFHDYGWRYPAAGYGGTFIGWIKARSTEPYDSWGNGSAMRVSPTAYARDSLDEVLDLARESSMATHSHPNGVQGAQATAGCVFLARTGHSKSEIREFVEQKMGYNLSKTIDEIRPDYSFDLSCAGSVPESIQAFLESDSFESAVQIAISLGGDADTMACIAGAIAEPFYGGLSESLQKKTMEYLDDSLRKVVQEFGNRFELGSTRS